jgi:hypothetical protein
LFFETSIFEPLKGGFEAKNTASREFGKTIVFLNHGCRLMLLRGMFED